MRALVIGAGIGGLTAGALLARRGWAVTVCEQAAVVGGCASTFRRGGFVFDVGATQVAGLEPGGIHHRLFGELGVEVPAHHPCDPACAVWLPGEESPILVWRDPERWRAERQRQFPGSEPFWQFMTHLFEVGWRFQSRDPVLPPRSWDGLRRLLGALRWETLGTFPYTLATVGDALRGFQLAGDRRLRAFLDLQLKLYSQVNAEETALLYGATALGVSQAPRGLFHLQGSMQVLADRLVEALVRHGGQLRLRCRAEAIAPKGKPQVCWHDRRTGETWWEEADAVVANVPVQNLVRLLGDWAPAGYRRRVQGLPPGSVAFVTYLGVHQAAIPEGCPPHLQLADTWGDYERSLFVSVSRPGDGRAPAGLATITASEFSRPELWWGNIDYRAQKQAYLEAAIARLGRYFDLTGNIVHAEAGTPRTFARYTDRDGGVVGGVGMRIREFGPFGFGNRTPVPHVWLVGDSTHPGEGTAGVSYSALSLVQQLAG